MKSFKKWWRELFWLKCDYCNGKTQYWFEAYLFPIKEYKGPCICPHCVEKIAQENKEVVIV